MPITGAHIHQSKCDATPTSDIGRRSRPHPYFLQLFTILDFNHANNTVLTITRPGFPWHGPFAFRYHIFNHHSLHDKHCVSRPPCFPVASYGTVQGGSIPGGSFLFSTA